MIKTQKPYFNPQKPQKYSFRDIQTTENPLSCMLSLPQNKLFLKNAGCNFQKSPKNILYVKTPLFNKEITAILKKPLFHV